MKLIFKNRISIFVTLFLLALLVWDLMLFLSPNKMTALNYWFNGGYGLMFLIAGVVGISYAKKIGLVSVMGRALSYVGFGLVSYSIAQFIWLYYNLFSSVEVPYPSVADIFFVLFYILVFIGFISLLKIFKQSITKQKIVQSVLLFPIVLAISLIFIFKPDLSPDLSFAVKALNIAYPVFDTLILYVVLVMLSVSGGYLKNTTWYFAFAGGVLLLGDFLFTYRTAKEIYWNGDVSDLVFLISAFLFFASFVYFNQKMIEMESLMSSTPQS